MYNEIMQTVNCSSTAVGAGEHNTLPDKALLEIWLSFALTGEIDEKFDLRVFNLIEAMRPYWNSPDPYPGGSINPIGFPEYDHNSFRAFYSDHHPVVFKLNLPAEDDD